MLSRKTTILAVIVAILLVVSGFQLGRIWDKPPTALTMVFSSMGLIINIAVWFSLGYLVARIRHRRRAS